MIDLSNAIIAENAAQDIADWPVTSQITRIRISPGRLCVDHTKRGKWPEETAPSSGHMDLLEGSYWVGALFPRQFATYEWARPNQECKELGVQDAPEDTEIGDQFAGHVKKGALANWRPNPGEMVYFMMSTLARNGERSSVNERSDIVGVPWPGRGESYEWIRPEGEEPEEPDEPTDLEKEYNKGWHDGQQAIIELLGYKWDDWLTKAADLIARGGKGRNKRAAVYLKCADDLRKVLGE